MHMLRLLKYSYPIIFLLCVFIGGCSQDELTSGDEDQENQSSQDTDAGENNEDDADKHNNDGTEESCNPVADPDCPCSAGQFRVCSTIGDPSEFPPNSACIPGFRRCVDGEWSEECEGEYVPADGDCSAQETSEECEGFINEYGDCVEGHSGPPADENVFCAGESSSEIGNPCSCEVPEDGEEFLRTNQPCYTGPVDSLGVGVCQAGVRDCQADGTWGPCQGQVIPASAETCGDGIDNTCSGIVDDGCSGSCPPGIENCDAYTDGYFDEPCPDGSPRNDCGGCTEVAESNDCSDGLDNACTGHSGAGCACNAPSRPCYLGPHETAGIGECEMGVQYCEGEHFGPCEGYVLPTPEQCGPDGMGNGLDNNCSGIVDEGCGCTDGETRPCGTNIGECEMGEQTCTDGAWGSCEGGVEPQTEVCDGLDNSCNGIIDDNLRNACGECEGPCYTHETNPSTGGEFEEGLEFIAAGDEGNPTDKDGVTLSQESTFPNYLWAANSSGNQPEGNMSSSGATVSKVDTDTGEEVGRYWAAENPSRTAVDLDGNVWVTGRNDGRLTKILWNETDCDPNQPTSTVDVNGNLTVENSAADPLADGCVVFSQNMSTRSENSGITYNEGRAVAVDAFGDVWVGYSHRGGAIQRINPGDFDDVSDTFVPTDIPRYAPDANGVQQPTNETGNAGDVYGLVADSQGYLYGSSLWDGDGLPRFNTQTGEWDRYYTGFNCAVYGIAVDAEDRIWMGCSEPGWGPNHNSIGGGLAVFDPGTQKVTRFYVPQNMSDETPAMGTTSEVLLDCPVVNGNKQCGSGWRVSAVGVEPNTGDVWATGRDNGYLLRLDVDESNFEDSRWAFIPVLREPSGNGAWIPEAGSNHSDMRGIGFDNNGFAWHLGMGSRYIFQIDPGSAAGEEEILQPHLVGDRGHYTYSDFTGSSAFNFTAPRGIWRYLFDSGIPTNMLDAIDVEATIPASTGLGVRIRPLDANGNPIDDWFPSSGGGSANYFDYPVGEDEHSFDLNVLIGEPLAGEAYEVEVRLTRTDNDIRPFLHNLDLAWHWP